MEFSAATTTTFEYFSTATQNAQAMQPLINNSNSNFIASKRKLDHDNEEYERSKRMHFADSTPTLIKEENVIHQQKNMPAITYALPGYKPFQLSANATANMGHTLIANYYNTPSQPMTTVTAKSSAEEEEDAEMEDDSTDEEDILQTPMTCFTSYIPHDIGIDIDQGGFTGSLERGWSEIFNEMI